MLSISNCHLFKIKRKPGKKLSLNDVREDYGVLKGSPTFWNPQIGCGQEDSNPRFGCTPFVPEGEYGPIVKYFFLININSPPLPGPDCRTWGQHNVSCLGSEHEERQLVGGEGGNPTGPGGSEGDDPGTPPHRAGSGV